MKKFFATVLSLSLLFFCSNDTEAQKGYSSGSRSYSSGSRSSTPSRSSSTPSRSTTSSRPVAPARSTPSTSSSSSSKPVTPSTPSKGYSSGSKSTSTPKSSGYVDSGGGYSKKPSGSFQSLAASEQKKSEARAAYQKATAPKESYTTPKGKTITIKPAEKKVIKIREMDHEKWVTRDSRMKDYYKPYINAPVTTYDDSYHYLFWAMMLNRNMEDRARWAYHHRGEMDPARYNDLLSKDAKLEARIKELETENKGLRDSTYLPPGVDDLDYMYDDDYVDAVVNPEQKPVNWGGFFGGLWTFIKWVFYISLVIGLIWFVFFYKAW
jgi:hypothetical protein